MTTPPHRLVALAIALILTFASVAEAVACDKPFGPLHQFLYATAPYPALQEAIIDCESEFEPGAYNDGSGASGLAQFMPSTFYDAQHAYGIDGSIWDPYVQIALMNAMINDGRIGEWSCYWIVVYGFDPD